MNARVQDSATGVFLSADSLISQPGYTQSYNRYGYVNNNPLSYNDPSGHCPWNGGTTPPNDGLPPQNYVPASAENNWIEEVIANGDLPGYELEEVVVTAEYPPEDMAWTENGGEGWGNNGDYNYNFGAPANDPTPASPDPCKSALRTAKQNQAAVQRARDNWPVLEAAASRYNIDPALLGAIGIRETGFLNKPQDGGGLGRGTFQIDLGAHPDVTEVQAYDLTFSANYAAKVLANNMALLGARFPNFTPGQLLQATAASYNIGTDRRRGISGNPNTIDVKTTHDNYGSNVVNLMQCF